MKEEEEINTDGHTDIPPQQTHQRLHEQYLTQQISQSEPQLNIDVLLNLIIIKVVIMNDSFLNVVELLMNSCVHQFLLQLVKVELILTTLCPAGYFYLKNNTSEFIC